MVAAVLLGYATVMGLAAPWVLGRAQMLERAPGLKLVLWQAASVSLLGSVLLAGVALAVPSVTVSGGLADLLNACVMALRAQYATPGGALAGVAGVALATVVVLRASTTVFAFTASTRRARREHRDGLTILGRTRGDLGVVVVEHHSPAVYCVPGRPGQVVVTSGALASLDDEELCAVLAHERAHLAARHHLAVGFAAALNRAFPRVPLFAAAALEASRIVELLADDAASRAAGRRPVATALVALAAGPIPSMALAASGPSALVRVERMLAPSRPLGRFAAAGVVVVALMVMSAPLAIAAEPALAARQMNLCPLSPTPAMAAAAHRLRQAADRELAG